MENLNTALQGWRQILGDDNVITHPERLDEAARATFATRRRIPAILRPGDRQQVSDSMRIASLHGISIYPISKGHNWGCGSRVPSGDDCVLLDLRRLNQIIDFSEELAYVTVEPGVTQQQLVDFLGAKQSRLMLSVTGAPPTASLRELRQRGVLRGGFTLFNDLRMFSIRQRFPWRLADGRAPLGDEQRRVMGKGLGGGRWFGEGALHSPSRAVGLAERKLVKRALAGKARKTLFMDAGKARWVKRLAPLLKRLSGHDMQAMLDLDYERNPQRGIPVTQPTKMAYWKKQTRPSSATVDLDPDRDRCGLIWCTPALPFTGEDVVRAVAIIENCLAAFGFDANIGLNFTSERIVEANVAIVYDRDHKGEDARAHNCHDMLLERLSLAGYLPSRLGIQSMSALPEAGDDSPGVLDDLKKLFDAEGILAPGRYQRLPESEIHGRG
ncbi:MAG: FAD-binding oxidoreductase [Gallionellaceae bacterium]|nr:FAD-binding oxidoreductase [Gallionellaceae bacterium]